MPAGIGRNRRTVFALAIVFGTILAAGGCFYAFRERLFDRTPPHLIIVAPTSSEIV
ncbi:MAG: hypothetical protein JO254_01955 [Pseudolabrys sp.]|nr:hypothetical protein [Pseudolabrys sp.]